MTLYSQFEVCVFITEFPVTVTSVGQSRDALIELQGQTDTHKIYQ